MKEPRNSPQDNGCKPHIYPKKDETEEGSSKLELVGNESIDIKTISAIPNHPEHGTSLDSNEQKVLNETFKIIKPIKVTRKKLKFAPPWIINKAEKEELDSSWKDAYNEVEAGSVDPEKNVIGSHVVFRIKKEEKFKKRWKARLCLHWQRDLELDDVRKDSSNIPLEMIRLLLNTAIFFISR